MTNYAYIRVSSVDQNEDRQMIAMRGIGISERCIYIDKQSGKDFHRRNYQRLIRRLRPGDVLYILSIDRLGRNYEEIQNQWRIITKEKRADIVVLDMPLLDTRREKNLLGTFISDLVLQLFSFIAENERESIRARQAAGIEAAKMRGVKFGRPEKEIPDSFTEAIERWKNNELKISEITDEYGISQSTFYRRVKSLCAEGKK